MGSFGSKRFKPEVAKRRSEEAVLHAGGEVCDWLPVIDAGVPRSDEEVVCRALVMNAMLQVALRAPTEIVASWLQRHGLEQSLSPYEREILKLQTDELSEQDQTNLTWYIEGLWILLWVGRRHADPGIEVEVPDTMASLCPNLAIDEGPEKMATKMMIRSRPEVMNILDLYYRGHWCARQRRLTGQAPGPFLESKVRERRRALEWVCDCDFDWDEGDLST